MDTIVCEVTGISIGECARQSGFSMDTLRYYERIGLIDPVSRNSTGQRRYTENHLAWLGILKCLRDTGMPIEHMKRYVELTHDGDSTIKDRIALLEEHHVNVQQRIEDMDSMRQHIVEKIEYYQSIDNG